MPHSDQSNLVCPICNRRASANQNTYIPFCSTRCQTIDLGNWLSDNYRIPVTSTDEDEFDTQDNESPETSE